MKDFSKGKIYTIRHLHSDDIYVGSTIQHYLSSRMALHVQNCHKENKGLLYQRMRETHIKEWYIELYEDFPCENINQLLKREGEIIRLIGTLNHNIAGRTMKEYYTDNKNFIMDRMKTYYKNNRYERLKYQNEYNDKKRTERIQTVPISQTISDVSDCGLD